MIWKMKLTAFLDQTHIHPFIDLDMEIFFTKRKSLREKCIEAYGEGFGVIYDYICRGVPVGGFRDTAIILQMIEDVKRK